MDGALTPFFQSDGIVKGAARDRALPLPPRIPWAERRMLLALCASPTASRAAAR